nr:MAG TPA: hypothetical protein [Caudoviricetes sp.]
MKKLKFNDCEEFACAIADKYDVVKNNDNLDSIGIIAKYYEAKEIIQELVGIGYGIAFITDFADPEYDGYNEEFMIALLDNEIWVEPAKRNGKYIYVETNVAYILGNCNSKVISMTEETDEVFEVEIGDYDCENCELNTTSTASYSINGKSVGKEEYENAMAEIDARYQDFRDEFAELMRSFW